MVFHFIHEITNMPQNENTKFLLTQGILEKSVMIQLYT